MKTNSEPGKCVSISGQHAWNQVGINSLKCKNCGAIYMPPPKEKTK